jgi:hypothetical protein
MRQGAAGLLGEPTSLAGDARMPRGVFSMGILRTQLPIDALSRKKAQSTAGGQICGKSNPSVVQLGWDTFSFPR